MKVTHEYPKVSYLATPGIVKAYGLFKVQLVCERPARPLESEIAIALHGEGIPRRCVCRARALTFAKSEPVDSVSTQTANLR